MSLMLTCSIFFFQAEDGIRDADVTGVQTCALPILQTFGQDLGEVALRPGTGGVFEIRVYMPDGSEELDRKSVV